jgi:integrase/recombinase XerD
VTINGALRALRAAVNLAKGNGRLSRAPTVKLLREGRKLPSILTLAQVDELASKACPEARRAIYLAAHAGFRHQECLHLAVGDIRLKDREIHLRAKPEVGWSPKSHHERAVPMSDRLVELLTPHVAGKAPGAWLFPGRDGKPRFGLHSEVRAAFRAAGLWDPERKPGLHMLRRTFASTLLTRGVDVQTVRELGGWADLVTVQRYLSSNHDVKRRAIDGVFGA